MAALFFVDSNLLLYRRDASEPAKQPLAATWLEALWRTRRGRISLQVLEEFYFVATHRLRPGLPREEARQEVRELVTWRPLPITASLVAAAWVVEERYRFSFWDSLIIAAARESGCRYLLTEDLQGGQEVDGVQVVDPFQCPPEVFGLSVG
ncbi:MAG: PIN domain-containing protein [Nitrospirae bacterium]|nr:MAG: PIN domain-containing protein [Nitrospirota bacterium]